MADSLITQRNSAAVLPLLWEFPGGRVEPGENEEAALQREVRGRIGADIEVRGKLGEHHHSYPHYEIHMSMFSCQLAGGDEPEPRTVNDLRWVTSF